MFSRFIFTVAIPLLVLWVVITLVKLPPTANNPYAAYHHQH